VGKKERKRGRKKEEIDLLQIDVLCQALHSINPKNAFKPLFVYILEGMCTINRALYRYLCNEAEK